MSLSSNSNRWRKRNLLPVWLGIFSLACLGIFGVALARAGTLSQDTRSNLDATASAQDYDLCQTLVEKAMQASEDHCDHMGPNQVCYGHITLKAELQPNVDERFSEQGDVVPVDQLLQLSATPLDVNTQEWGVAIFKVMANLPGSLPGQTITMIAFGNIVLDNRSDNLEAFYFSNELGRLVCEKAPYDGLLITMPNGAGVHFNINGTEFTLKGDASLTATKNGKMEITLYEGDATLISAGKEQAFKAGEVVTVPLGGEGGTQAVGVPSLPMPLSPTDWGLHTFIPNRANNAQDEQYEPPTVIDIPDETIELDEDSDNLKEEDKEKDKEKDKDKDKDKNKDKDKDKNKEKDKDKEKEKDK